jgi:hypothetical protein
MSSLYNNFEKRFTDKWFSAGWVDVEVKVPAADHKDLVILEAELNQISEKIETIAQNQLRLANLSKLYN